MSKMFNEFDLDVQKVAGNYETPNGEGRGITTTVSATLISMNWSCVTCMESGKTSDLCDTENCSQLTYCAECAG